MDCSNNLEIIRITDPGKRRENNEDYVASDISIGYIILADGVGGGNAGELASEMTVITSIAYIKKCLAGIIPGILNKDKNLLEEAVIMNDSIFIANSEVFNLSKQKPEYDGMSTTVVTGIFVNNTVTISHVGDSRAYLYRDHYMKLITRDHSWINEQIDSGFMTEEMALTSRNKNLITRAVGSDPTVKIDTQVLETYYGDIILFCSDGLSDLVDGPMMGKIISENVDNLKLIADKLVQKANDLGGKDNISVVLARVKRGFKKQSFIDKILDIFKKK